MIVESVEQTAKRSSQVGLDDEPTSVCGCSCPALLGKLEDGQRRLKAGEPQQFELLAGSIASYDKSSPRDVFLQVPFQKVWNIERVPNEYRITYSPEGLGQLRALSSFTFMRKWGQAG